MLGINPDKVRYIITEARTFDGKEGDSDPDSGSNAADDGMADVLEDQPDDAATHGACRDETATGERLVCDIRARSNQHSE